MPLPGDRAAAARRRRNVPSSWCGSACLAPWRTSRSISRGRSRPARSCTRACSCSRRRASRRLPPDCSCAVSRSRARVYALAVGTEGELQARRATGRRASRAEPIRCPSWLKSDPARRTPHTYRRASARSSARRRELTHALDALGARHDLGAALGDAERLQWVIENVHALESGALFCWITGWTSELSGDRLAQALERSGARAILHYPPAPPGTRGAAGARQSRLGAAVRGLQPRARNARAQRGRSDDAARRRRAADVRLHVRRRRPGTRHRRRRIRAAQALAARAAVRRRRHRRDGLRRALRQRVQPAGRRSAAVARAARRPADRAARSALRRRGAADDRAAPERRRSVLARRAPRLVLQRGVARDRLRRAPRRHRRAGAFCRRGGRRGRRSASVARPRRARIAAGLAAIAEARRAHCCRS